MQSPQQLFARLEQLGIAQRTVEHPAVFTVEEAKALRGDLPGHHVKNLFLRNKKEEMWLVVALEDRAIDLKRLGQVLGAGRLSFGSAERLKRHLGVDTLLLGWGQNDDNLHGPNEKFCLADFHRGIKASAHLLDELARESV